MRAVFFDISYFSIKTTRSTLFCVDLKNSIKLSSFAIRRNSKLSRRISKHFSNVVASVLAL